jgi:hypothetical protein
MMKSHLLILGFGLGLGVLLSTAINRSEQVDYDKLQSMVSKAVKTEMVNHRSSVPLSQTVSSSTPDSFSGSDGIVSDDPLLGELKQLFTELSMDLRRDIQDNMANLAMSQNGNAAVSEARKPLTPEQQAQQSVVIEQATGYIYNVIDRGVWDATDAEKMRNLMATLPANESVKIQQQLLAAMNDGRVKTDLGPMDLF